MPSDFYPLGNNPYSLVQSRKYSSAGLDTLYFRDASPMLTQQRNIIHNIGLCHKIFTVKHLFLTPIPLKVPVLLPSHGNDIWKSPATPKPASISSKAQYRAEHISYFARSITPWWLEDKMADLTEWWYFFSSFNALNPLENCRQFQGFDQIGTRLVSFKLLPRYLATISYFFQSSHLLRG